MKKNKTSPIDRHDLKALEKEYIEITLAVLTDDVTIDPKGYRLKDERLADIEDDVGQDMVQEWGRIAIEKAKKIGYASGKEFTE